jgi:hypothetical protein
MGDASQGNEPMDLRRSRNCPIAFAPSPHPPIGPSLILRPVLKKEAP